MDRVGDVQLAILVAVAGHLAARGTRVLVNDVVGERAEATAEAIRGEAGAAEAWPFASPAYPGREITWEDWAALPEG